MRVATSRRDLPAKRGKSRLTMKHPPISCCAEPEILTGCQSFGLRLRTSCYQVRPSMWSRLASAPQHALLGKCLAIAAVPLTARAAALTQSASQIVAQASQVGGGQASRTIGILALPLAPTSVYVRRPGTG